MLSYGVTGNRVDEHSEACLMCTDIWQTERGYEMAIDLPGVKKEDLNAEFKDGYLYISATVHPDNEPNTRYLRRERFAGTVRRAFYVGNKVAQQDIRAKFDNGTLYLVIPKMHQPESRGRIVIDG